MEQNPLINALYLALYAIGIVWPIAIVFRRTGRSAWWSVFAALLPLLPVALWVLAKATWPVTDADGPEQAARSWR